MAPWTPHRVGLLMSVEGRVFLGIVRVADRLVAHMAAVLEPRRLTLSQYGVLEALRQAGDEGLACGEIAERMITRDPDVTRLLDRLEDRGYVSRYRGRPDRRVVRSRLTPSGVDVLAELDAPMRALHIRQLRGVGRRELGALETLLGSAESTMQGARPRRAPASA
jgi:DNA-binding MarR family transcriptional regulator